MHNTSKLFRGLSLPVKVCLGKLTAIEMTPLGWLGAKTSIPTVNKFNWSSSSGEEAKIDFQDGCQGGHQSIQEKSIGLSVQEKKRKIDFHNGGYL